MRLANAKARSPDAHLIAYVSVAAVLTALLVIQTLQQQWGVDFWVHLATVRAFAEHPIHPLEPFTGVATDDPLLSPYMFVLGLASRLLRADPITVLMIAGLLNLGLWLFALWRFVLTLTGNRAAPVWTLLFTLLAWGIDPWRFSGFFNLNSIGFGLPYPAVLATAIAMLALASTSAWLQQGGRRNILMVGASIPIVLLTHPFTAVWVAIAGAAIVVSYARRAFARRLATLAAVFVAALALALLWPHYSLLRLAAIGSQFNDVHDGLYVDLVTRAFLMVPGLVILALRARRRFRDPLVLMFLGTLTVFVLGGVSHAWALGRVFPGMMLAVHTAFGDAVGKYLADSRVASRLRILVASGVTALLLIGLAGSALGIVHMVPRALLPGDLAHDPRLRSIIDPYQGLFDLLQSRGRVLASPSLNRVIAGITGNVLVPPVPTFLEDVRRRSRDARVILSPATSSQQRRVLLDRNDIQFIVVTPSEAEVLICELREDASLVAARPGYVAARPGYVVFRILDRPLPFEGACNPPADQA